MPHELLQFGSEGPLFEAVSSRLVSEVLEGGCRTLALCGGRSAAPLLEAVVAESRRRSVRWSGVRVFWSDERCVPPGDPRSNYGLARRHLLDALDIPGEHIHRLRGEADPTVAAAEAEALMRRWVPLGPSACPSLDVVLLGMGEDGHVASLFPGAAEALVAGPRLVVPVVGPKPPLGRLTMTYPVIEAARQVWVMVTGPGKEEALTRSLEAGPLTPLGRVLASRSQSLVFSAVGGVE